jgi:hypothetical protein
LRIFKTRWMARFARKSRIDDALLVEAIERAEKGLIDADLGGGVIKQRVGRPGQGRSSGYRTLIAIRKGDRAIFVFAFAKNEQDNITPAELWRLKEFAQDWLSLDDENIGIALRSGELEEVKHGRS